MIEPKAPPRDTLESARCEQCGYPLRGLESSLERGVNNGVPRCPECGTTFDPRKPWTPLPWPSKFRLAWFLSGPLAAIVFALIGSGAARGTRQLLVWPFSLIWVWALLFFTFLWPIMAATSLAADRLPQIERARAVRDVCLPTILFNVAAAVAGLVMFFAMA